MTQHTLLTIRQAIRRADVDEATFRKDFLPYLRVYATLERWYVSLEELDELIGSQLELSRRG